PRPLKNRIVARGSDPPLPPPAPPSLHEHHVHREAVQPGAERALPPERGEPLPRAHERVLGALLGGPRVAREAQAQGVDAPGVLVVELPEGRLVPVPRPADEVRQLRHGAAGWCTLVGCRRGKQGWTVSVSVTAGSRPSAAAAAARSAVGRLPDACAG